MANEFQHKDPGSALTQAEYITTDGTGHIFDCQATGDILYASSATVLKNLDRGNANEILSMGGSCIPAWTASPSVTDLTIGGGCITLSAATDIDLLDNNASALSFDATGKTGIIDIVTTDGSEGVTMSGTLGVTGLLTAGSLDVDDVLISGTTIGHTCDTDLLTLGNATLLAKGTVTVGVDDTGHDVKFFGAAAGSFALWDEDLNLLELRGATAAGPGHLKLTTGEATVVACDVLGKIEFQAPAETGTDAIVVSASIAAVAQDTFAAAVNATDLVFYTGHSEVATEKFRFTSQGEIGIGGATYGTDGYVLTSGGAGAAVAWEAAGGGNEITTIVKPSIQSYACQTTLQCDSSLKFAVAACTNYFVEVLAQAGGTNDGGGFKVGWELPPNASHKSWSWGMQNNTTGVAAVSTTSHQEGDWTIVTGSSGKNASTLLIRSRVAVGACTGCVTFQWAQEATSGNAATVAAGSILTWVVVN